MEESQGKSYASKETQCSWLVSTSERNTPLVIGMQHTVNCF